ncbi:MAG: TolC family protein [Pseudomonadota bacterium]
MAGLLFLVFQQTAQATNQDSTSWNDWFYQQILQHPEVVAEREKMNAQLSTAEARDQPLYNPELEAEVEREGEDNNSRLGVSQTLDWWDKRGARQNQGNHARQVAQTAYQQVLQQKLTDALLALNDWQSAQQRVAFAREQESQLDALLALVEQRQKTGDLGQIDAELALLALAQLLNDSADAEAQLAKAGSKLKELFPEKSPDTLAIPDTFWQQSRSVDAARLVDQHPRVVQALAEWNAAKAQAEVAVRDAKSDPTLGINGGKSGEDNVVALTLSIPLALRNDYRAEVRAASQESLAAEARYYQIRRQQLALLEGSEAALNAYSGRHERWRRVMQARVGNSASLLEKQWRTGDLSTPDYLLALKERGESLQAGIELQSEWHQAVIEWLLESGQLIDAIQRN